MPQGTPQQQQCSVHPANLSTHLRCKAVLALDPTMPCLALTFATHARSFITAQFLRTVKKVRGFSITCSNLLPRSIIIVLSTITTQVTATALTWEIQQVQLLSTFSYTWHTAKQQLLQQLRTVGVTYRRIETATSLLSTFQPILNIIAVSLYDIRFDMAPILVMP